MQTHGKRLSVRKTHADARLETQPGRDAGPQGCLNRAAKLHGLRPFVLETHARRTRDARETHAGRTRGRRPAEETGKQDARQDARARRASETQGKTRVSQKLSPWKAGRRTSHRIDRVSGYATSYRSNRIDRSNRRMEESNRSNRARNHWATRCAYPSDTVNQSNRVGLPNRLPANRIDRIGYEIHRSNRTEQMPSETASSSTPKALDRCFRQQIAPRIV